ncbi:MAG: hypothetical protein KDD82_23795 [Planctomycetes bacterium]|nr:hypothetical protein [Planctomycetota bacterium]
MSLDGMLYRLVEERSLEALEALTSTDDESVLESLIEAAGQVIESGQLDENEEPILETIRSHLLECKAKGPLVDSLSPNNGNAAREFALSVLSELGDQSAVPDMIPLLEDRDEGVKNAAAEHLALLTNYDFGLDAAKWRDYYQRLIMGRIAYEKEEEQERLEKLAAKRARQAKKEEEDLYADAGDYGDGGFGNYGG